LYPDNPVPPIIRATLSVKIYYVSQLIHEFFNFNT
jgi:hypothetical protein